MLPNYWPSGRSVGVVWRSYATRCSGAAAPTRRTVGCGDGERSSGDRGLGDRGLGERGLGERGLGDRFRGGPTKRLRGMGSPSSHRLYRSACADLALAASYQMPPSTEAYLQRLVARAHNQLYRSESLTPRTWARTILVDAPRIIFVDPCVRVAAIIFFGLFALSMMLGRSETATRGFAASVLGRDQLAAIEEMFREPLSGSMDHYVGMAAFYIKHNTGIGLVCFGLGILIVPCLFTLAYNAVSLGTTFGYMARSDVVGSDNFFEFVTAHGPFELTAIVLAAAAGLKLGVGLFATGGLRRIDSVRLAAVAALPVMAASATLFVAAALTEGFISPSPLPYLVKCSWAILSSGLMSFYFVVLGFPRHNAA